MKEILKSNAFALMAVLAALTAIKSTQYLTGNPDHLDPIFRDKYLSHLPLVITHGVCAITALVIGPVQFIAGARKRFLRAHRIAGRVYMAAILGGGVTGFFMGTMAFGGIAAKTAFSAMALLWLVTGWLGLTAARGGRIAEHRRWMIRNYALTFGAVTLRLQLSLLQWAGFDYATVYPFVSWTAWVPNLIAAEMLIGRVTRPPQPVSI